MARYSLAHIKAAPEYIAFLRQALRSPDMFVGRAARGDALVLRLEREKLDSTDAWNEAAAAIRALLGALNAFANLIGPISITTPVSAVDEDGRAETAGATLEFNVRIKSEEGRQRLLDITPDKNDTMASRIVRLAREHPDVARALGLIESRDPSWADIYLLMEIVEVNLRRHDGRSGKNWAAIAKQGWLSSATLDAIKRNAGYQRHAKQFSPPNPLMPLWEAQGHSKYVIRRWLEQLAGI